MNLSFFSLTALSFLLTLTLTGWLKTQFKTQLLDIPNDRSSHTQPTPRGGGLAFIVTFLLTITSTQFLNLPSSLPLLPLWLILTPLALIGFIDDRTNLPAAIRYLVQLATAAIALWHFGPLPLPGLPQIPILIIAIPLTLIAFTALINFYNFMDGLDGLVASLTALQLAFLALYLHQPLWWLLVAALLGFLYWNWSPAKIFMGDVGSTVLGACIAIALLNSPQPTQLWSALPIIFPLIGDAIYTLIRRSLKQENIFQAHRTHLYQRLQQSGWSHSQVAIAYLLLTTLIALLTTTLGSIGSILSLGIVIGAIALTEHHLTPSP